MHKGESIRGSSLPMIKRFGKKAYREIFAKLQARLQAAT